VKVRGGGNVNASVHEDTSWYCTNEEHVTFFFIIITISFIITISTISVNYLYLYLLHIPAHPYKAEATGYRTCVIVIDTVLGIVSVL
jgi:maltodextrin utilization protein YvdJ